MKISFLIPAMVLYIVRVSFCNDIQVGTVLFTKTDLVRKCWTESDKALLRARLVMQDVLPDPSCIDFSKPSAVTIILDYINACFHIVRTSTCGKVQNLMYLALSDAVGGYLRAYVLPNARKSYYAGQMNYEDACRVFTLYDDIRRFLKTSGKGWTVPQKVVYKRIKVSPLDIIGGNPEACKILYIIEEKGKIHCINTKCCTKPTTPSGRTTTRMPAETKTDFQEFSQMLNGLEISTEPYNATNVTTPCESNPLPFQDPYDPLCGKEASTVTTERQTTTESKNISVTESSLHRKAGEVNPEYELYDDSEVRNVRCECCEDSSKNKTRYKDKGLKRVIVPLPMMDDECDPNTIAVPFRKRPLRNLWKKSSAFVLEQYYVAVLQCFISKGNTRADIRNFNSQFHNWLSSMVYPRLEDERWYPAFGGVLRIRETIKRFGMEARLNEPMTHDVAFMFDNGVGFDYPEIEETYNFLTTEKESVAEFEEVEYPTQKKSQHYYLIIIAIGGLFWILSFCVCGYIFLRVKNKSSKSDKVARMRSYQDIRVTPSEESGTDNSDKKAVSFQFLVRFFKKSEGNQNCRDDGNDNCDRKKLLKDSCTMEGKQSHRRPVSKIKDEKGDMLKKCDQNKYYMSDMNKTPSWCCVTEKFEMPIRMERDGGRGHICQPIPPRIDPPQTIKTIWKNPFVCPAKTNTEKGFDPKKRAWFKLEPKKKGKSITTQSESITGTTNDSKTSSDKRSSTYSYSEGCPNSCTSTTNCTSHTHLKEKCSSATMEFFENVQTRHKPTKKCLKQKSSTETETEDDSYTSENEY